MRLFGRATPKPEDRTALPEPRLERIELSEQGLVSITDEALFDMCGTRISFTERTGGVSEGPYASLNLGDSVGDDQEAVYQNRRRILTALGLSGYLGEFINPRQVHGTDIFVADRRGCDISPCLEGVDAVVALDVGIPVMLCYADCTPVIIVAPGGMFAIAHAGWRGALGGIAGKSAVMLAGQTGCDTSELNVYIGPHIRSCCYETSQEILDDFVAEYGDWCDRGRRRLSLSAAVRSDLVAHGVLQNRIAEVGECTSCNDDRFFSYRSSGGTCGRHAAIACHV